MITKNTKLRLVISLVLALLLIGFLVLDLLNMYKQNTDTVSLLARGEESEHNEVLLHSIRSFKESAKEELETLSSLVLTPQTLVNLIESLEGAGRSLGLETDIVSVTKIDEGGVPKVTIVIESNGSWQGNFSYLKAVESLPYQIKLSEAHLTKEKPDWRSNITLSLHSFIE